MLAEGGCQIKLSADLLPPSTEAADQYCQETGGNLTRQSTFGTSPFTCAAEQQRVEQDFAVRHQDMGSLFDKTIKRQPEPFQEAVLSLIDIVKNRQHV